MEKKSWWRRIPGFRSGKWWKMIIASVFYAFLALVILGAILSPKQTTPTGPAASGRAEEEKPSLELLESHFVRDQFFSYVIGTVRNNTERKYKYVEVDINFYDKNGAQVGNTFTNTTNLEPGALWKFKALVTADNVASYKIMEVTGH